MTQLLWVCVGSALGGGARYLVATSLMRSLGGGFPYGTLAVNAVGSFTLALLMVLGTHTTWMSPSMRLALTVGAMGGFTTYSTFSYETLEYLQEGAWHIALVNTAVTVLGCLGTAWLGGMLGRRLLGL